MTKGTETVTVETTEAPGYEGKVAVVEPPPVKSWKAYDGRTQVGRNPREKGGQTNGDYAGTQDHFRKACEAAETPATARQASKFRRKKGIAYAASLRLKNAKDND
jgi:hypothetical protein